MAQVYGVGAAVGFTPQMVDQMSIWQFNAAVEGVIKSRGGKEGLSESEKDTLWSWLEAANSNDVQACGFVYELNDGVPAAVPL